MAEQDRVIVGEYPPTTFYRRASWFGCREHEFYGRGAQVLVDHIYDEHPAYAYVPTPERLVKNLPR